MYNNIKHLEKRLYVMQYSIPFGNTTLSFDLDETKVKYYASPSKIEIPTDVDALIEASLDTPIGSERLEVLLHSDMQVMILIDDVTRPTPKSLLLQHILKRVHLAGISKENVTICIAPGTHRPMTEDEKRIYIGENILKNYKLINQTYSDTDALQYIGDSPSGIPIDIYKAALDMDFIIGIGNIVPHVTAGWGGGAKIVQPGICGERTTAGTHSIAALDQNVMETCGNAENPCRHEMELIAEKVGLKFIVNTVMDENRHILGVFSGDFVKAHRKGVEMARPVFGPEIPCKTDIVIASANPANLDYWQAAKPFIFAQYGLKDNGTLIFVLSGEEGLCGNSPHHEDFLRKFCTKNEEEIREFVEKGLIEDLIAIDAPIHLDQVRKRGVNTLLVSSHLTKTDAEALGFELCQDMEDAISRASARQGAYATIGIIPYCGETLVHEKQNR